MHAEPKAYFVNGPIDFLAIGGFSVVLCGFLWAFGIHDRTVMIGVATSKKLWLRRSFVRAICAQTLGFFLMGIRATDLTQPHNPLALLNISQL